MSEETNNVVDAKSNAGTGKAMTLDDYFKTGVFTIGMLLALVATFQFYFSVQNAIGMWFEYQYVPIFTALYSLVILTICLYLIRLYVLARK